MTDVKGEHKEVSRLGEHYKEVEKIWESLEGTNQKLDALLARVTDTKKDQQTASSAKL